MKILIITHSLRYNYGGILQNYALQQVLKNMGHTVITLKLRRKLSFYLYAKNLIKYLLLKLGGFDRIKPLSEADLNLICCNTDKFIDANITMSPSMDLIDKNWVKKQNIDAIIVGSDQVLHPASYKKIEEIYLNFISHVKKIIYAGSFGSEKWHYSEQQTLNCSKLLCDFDGISCRENSGVIFFKDKFYKSAKLVLDPTLLLDKEIYLKLIPHDKYTFGVVSYILDLTEEKEYIIKYIQEKLNLPGVKAGNPKMDSPIFQPQERITEGVESWLMKMSKADFIVTDSYHGTCFAILFKKNFIVIANRRRGLDRFVTLLSRCSLENRLIYDIADISDDLINMNINYDDVDKLLEPYKKESIAFLDFILNN